jgi:hypothetical protein
MHKLKPLNKRLTGAQQLKRREKMHNRGTARQEMQNDIAQTRGIVAQAFKIQNGNIKRMQNRALVVNIVMAIAIIAMALKIAGVW